MESQSFYDERSPDLLAGVFDLRGWPEPFRRSLVAAVNGQLRRNMNGEATLALDPVGYATLAEPPLGPDLRWFMLANEVHKTLELAVAAPIPPAVRVARVYRLDFDRFTEADWQAVLTLFTQLPEWRGLEPYPHWFGEREGPPPFLGGSFVPDGFRVEGCLPRRDWVLWDTFLRDHTGDFPLLP